MQRIIKRFECENARLFADIKDFTTLLADCEAELEIIEEVKHIRVLGSRNCKVKKRMFNIVICDEMDTTREITMELLGKIRNYSLSLCWDRALQD